MKALFVQGAEARAGGIRRAAAICALVLTSVAAQASTSTASFGVAVTLFPSFKDTAECGQATSGVNVTISCSSSAPSNGSSPRFMLELYRDGAKLGTVDGETVPGSVASWKVYHAANRDFLEIVVGW